MLRSGEEVKVDKERGDDHEGDNERGTTREKGKIGRSIGV